MQCNHSNDPYLQYLCTDDGNHVHDCVLRMIVYENSVIVWPAIPMVTGAAILTNRAPPPLPIASGGLGTATPHLPVFPLHTQPVLQAQIPAVGGGG